MNSSVFRCNVCNKVYKYQKSYLEHCRSHEIPQLPYNLMAWNNQQHQYPYYCMALNNQYPVPISIPQYPISNQYTEAMQWYQYTTPTYYPMVANNQFNIPIQYPEQTQQQQPKIQEEAGTNCNNNTIMEEEDMDISNLSSDEEDTLMNETKTGGAMENNEPRYYEINRAFKNNIISYGIPNKKDQLLFEEFIIENKHIFKERLENGLLLHNIIKFNITLIGEYIKIVGEEMDLCHISHRAKMSLLCRGDNIDELLLKQVDEIHNKMSEFQERDSGWTLIRIVRLEININKSSLVKGSYWISTPEKLANRRACINVENTDNYCFKWALIAAMQIQHSERCSSYNIDNIRADIINLQNNVTLDFSYLKFPLKLKDIKIFEEKNSNISVNVFGYDEDTDEVIGPFYITKEEKSKHVNLLLLEIGGGHHYIFIKDISK